MKTEFRNTVTNPKVTGVIDVAVHEVNEKRHDVAVIDVRRPDEYVGELGHIPGAKLLTLDELPQRLDELPQDKTIVFVCRSGQRSAQAAQFAQENGLADVYNMAGGMLAWNEQQLEVKDKNPGF